MTPEQINHYYQVLTTTESLAKSTLKELKKESEELQAALLERLLPLLTLFKKKKQVT